jgi:hypothetical protein
MHILTIALLRLPFSIHSSTHAPLVSIDKSFHSLTGASKSSIRMIPSSRKRKICSRLRFWLFCQCIQMIGTGFERSILHLIYLLRYALPLDAPVLVCILWLVRFWLLVISKYIWRYYILEFSMGSSLYFLMSSFSHTCIDIRIILDYSGLLCWAFSSPLHI